MMKSTSEATNQELVSGINICMMGQVMISSKEDKLAWRSAASEMMDELASRNIEIIKGTNGLYRLA